MYRPTPTGLALIERVLLMTILALLVTACGSPEKAKPRPQPEAGTGGTCTYEPPHPNRSW
jgi:hypothetical protein